MKPRATAATVAFALSAALALAVTVQSPSRASSGLVWPNAESSANSDPWIAEHHDEIELMRPRVLVLDFVNGMSRDQARAKAVRLSAAIAESSRHHGYADPGAPVFLDYQIAGVVDLTDDATASVASAGEASAGAASAAGPTSSVGITRALEGAARSGCDCPAPVGAARDLPDPTGPYEDRFRTPDGNSSFYPRLAGETRFNFDYSALFSMDMARRIGVKDGDAHVNLTNLVARGLVNEVWVIARQVDGTGGPAETAEQVRAYDANRRPLDELRDAGNGAVFPSVCLNRSLRIVFVNADRGVGCALHSLGHSLERIATSGAIPYFTRYFREFAQLDLDERWGLPFGSFYDLDGERDALDFPAADRLVIDRAGTAVTLEGYVATGGNCHFPPNARRAYDYANEQPVCSTIEHYRLRDDGGKDRAEPWTPARFAALSGTAPDSTCGGDWLVYWRQNMPGLRNKARDASGRPMKNWWPFLFY